MGDYSRIEEKEMREFKFRLWDENAKLWISRGESVEMAFSQNFPESISAKAEYCLEQYTGLTDKNGNEIYEGDIIKDTSDGDCLINAIFWCEKGGFWGVKPRSPFADRDWGWFIGREDVEVIGNIHENPELLEAGV